MLVLAHADGLGVNLHQLGQRVLQAPGNAGRAAQADVNVGHFLAGELAGAVNRSARLAHHHLLHGRCAWQASQLLDQVAGQFVGLAAGGAVANGDQVDLVLFAQFGQGEKRAVPVFAWLVGVDGCGVILLDCPTKFNSNQKNSFTLYESMTYKFH